MLKINLNVDRWSEYVAGFALLSELVGRVGEYDWSIYTRDDQDKIYADVTCKTATAYDGIIEYLEEHPDYAEITYTARNDATGDYLVILEMEA